MKPTRLLWQSIEPVYRRILDHPFVTGLTDGSLSGESFKFYAVQDALYLQDFARGLAILGAKAGTDDDLIMFCEHARNAILVERALHEQFFAEWNLSPSEVYATPMAPTTLSYTSFLIRIAYEKPFHEALGAFLPCYWIYLEVGKALLKKGSSDENYQAWIDTYAGAEFEEVVNQVISLTDRVAESLTDEQFDRLKRHFVTTSKFEYMFWDMGYKQLNWDV